MGKQVPPLNWLIAAAARQFTPEQVRLDSPLNYAAGVLLVYIAIRQHALTIAREAKR